MKIEELAAAWLAAKNEEAAARARRVQVESDIISLLGHTPEGAQTHSCAGYQITVTGKVTRTLDVDKWHEVCNSIPEALRPVTYKPTLDIKGVKYLHNNEPEIYARLAPAITTKPAKTAISIKEA